MSKDIVKTPPVGPCLADESVNICIDPSDLVAFAYYHEEEALCSTELTREAENLLKKIGGGGKEYPLEKIARIFVEKEEETKIGDGAEGNEEGIEGEEKKETGKESQKVADSKKKEKAEGSFLANAKTEPRSNPETGIAYGALPLLHLGSELLFGPTYLKTPLNRTLASASVSPSEKIGEIRESRLIEPALLLYAGVIFRNPIVDHLLFEKLVRFIVGEEKFPKQNHLLHHLLPVLNNPSERLIPWEFGQNPADSRKKSDSGNLVSWLQNFPKSLLPSEFFYPALRREGHLPSFPDPLAKVSDRGKPQMLGTPDSVPSGGIVSPVFVGAPFIPPSAIRPAYAGLSYAGTGLTNDLKRVEPKSDSQSSSNSRGEDQGKEGKNREGRSGKQKHKKSF